MSAPTTSWDLIRGAAAGDDAARAEFSRVYAGVVRGALGGRWKGSPLAQELDDAVQDVWIECFKEGGALEGATERAGRGFRAFLYGVTLNVARRREERRRDDRGVSGLGLESLATTLASLFDRQWARALVIEARDALLVRARQLGADAVRRVEILRLRFFEDLAIKEIADLWNEDPARLHHQYATARDEFRACLRDSIRRHEPGNPAEVERELERLVKELA